jgi:hypothetical protein
LEAENIDPASPEKSHAAKELAEHMASCKERYAVSMFGEILYICII